ncbi:integration host factor subunit beta [Thiotrichales bacterium 19S11-10]|nr:integration host factor subunit beta [Thiotrichales bacterium 19S11-10]MCF6807326.1 integration host factor subunit beta [Thiotrichales bacterium 19S9-11]MCF6811295.1 integration host factor subunit beta [Thiotrichales bacterium 19S9-12]
MSNNYVTRSEMIKKLSQHVQVHNEHAADAVKTIVNIMSQALANNRRIEIRGFGSFEVHEHKNKVVRNPKTGAVIPDATQYAIHFKPGKKLREDVINL